MIRRPPRSTPLYSSAASDVYKRQTNYIMSSFGTNGGNQGSDTCSVLGNPGNGCNDTLKLFLSYSTDGVNYKLLNTPIYSDPSGVLRDPDMTFFANQFWVAHLTGETISNANQLVIISSPDLLTWTRHKIPVTGLGSRTWAPAFYVKSPGCTGGTCLLYTSDAADE